MSEQERPLVEAWGVRRADGVSFVYDNTEDSLTAQRERVERFASKNGWTPIPLIAADRLTVDLVDDLTSTWRLSNMEREVVANFVSSLRARLESQ